MFTDFLILSLLFLFFQWSIERIKYFNKLDKRFGSSLWRWSYDYPVKGKSDISYIDDKGFVLLRRKRNKAVTIMYSIVFFSFIVLMSFISEILLKILN
tara:strand:+ start:1434 stop:1727 length:294 start_codon:yes stop_codon:yes gene_type:complete